MIAIIKYNAGNIFSVRAALGRLGAQSVITGAAAELKAAQKIIFPGVGEAGTAMAYLKKTGLDEIIKNLKVPVLGICLGMQLLCKKSEEGGAKCLGVFDAEIKKFQSPTAKIPHIGWNNITDVKAPLFDKSLENAYVYFVHGYYAPLCAATAARADYILPFSAALQKDNFYAAQFHPEKSGDTGEKILKNFLEL